MTNSIIILFLFIFSSSALLITPSNQADLLSLLAFKEAIDVDPNGALNSWNRTTNFCTWDGITCGRKHTDRVVGIKLDSQGLTGSLSPHIGNLSFLREINLQNNSFNGRIPQEIGLLRRLEYIEFSNNSFMGRILPENISQWKNLVYLNLIDNNLTGPIPPGIRFLEKLEALGLGDNKISGAIPQYVGNLTSLRQLSLRSCDLNGEIPESLGQLQKLRLLNLGDNNLTGTIPPSFFNISTIRSIAINNNGLHGSIPSTIGHTLPNLLLLYMAWNQLTGRFPVSISNASSLQLLDFPFNHFSGPLPSFEGLSQLQFLYAAKNNIEDDISLIVSSLTNCTNLQGLDLSQNPLSGSIPETVGNLSIHLDHIGLAHTLIHGKIPYGVGNLVGLTYLYLKNNNLEGPLPLSIGKLSNLGILYLGENRFAGEIPSIFGNLSLLTNLYMQGNNFSGAIPKSIGNCSKLLGLYLSRNNLSGLIPQELMNLSSISISLDLSYNEFTGSIPVEVGSLRNLASLDFSNNRLSGLIPNSLRTCISLERLYLQGNLFEGQIPQGLSSLTGLLDLDLSRNNLSGTIPLFFGTLRLQQLNLSFNMLQGQVPTTGVFKNKTAISIQGNKDLCGGVPELELSLCTSSSVSSKKKNLSTPLKIAIPLIVGVAAIMCLVVVFLHRRRASNKSPPSPELLPGIPFLRLSYSDLLKATGGFAETSLVGVGSFGSVYKGILDDGLKTIAVKVLNLMVKGASKSFMAECNALREIRHRNLVKILSVCESIDFQGNDFKAIVYEFKANGSLDKWLYYNDEQEQESDARDRNLCFIQRLDIAIDVAQALEYLHCGTDSVIVHGDLKPSNILLDQDMTAFVGDFGLSKIISSIIPTHESSNTIGIKGTFGYVPPEYGMSNLVSTKGDIYSYGILVLEIFTNRRPTDDSFNEHVNLHNFVSAALPDRVMEIVAPLIRIGSDDMDNRNAER
ncbi:PREDICTED: probable LRR receptor-like serine/threonine-protein kinase At3g47570 [Erythranthe guttata]|uniref:probable LRR receptor-like serine/threonine-protein kinase At3g47570 n=1 Tax=Erythranthe guttata TaxID=4155 RepID=UPI00064DB0DF|nr:PREDICTED: probable LRR receptor-like serine/threonine-protein kinase At3g47570 [Erythranthe guttata]|eukprot:XP_012829143.1 PREDICTED: probable LRR receptor-like serine/threonine-protein kinase At3g47570 [Erythranthe guttata]